MQFLMYELKTQGWFEMIVQDPKIQNVVMANWHSGLLIFGSIFKCYILVIPIE